MAQVLRTSIATGTAVLALLACSSSASARSRESYPTSFERAFIASCSSSSGGRTSMCRCSLRWIERHYTYGKLTWIYVHDKARMRRIMTSAVVACLR